MTNPEPDQQTHAAGQDLVGLSALTTLQPRNLDEAMHLSKVLAQSALVPWTLQGKPADILVILMYGVELDLPVIQALNAITVIKGRPSLSSDLRVSKTRQRGHRVGIACATCGHTFDQGNHRGQGAHRFDPDWTAERCTVIAERRDTGETAYVTYTLEDAVKQRLVALKDGKPYARSTKGEALPWETATRDMLYHRAADRACKQIAPEVAFGLYTAEEIERMPAIESAPVRVDASVGEPVAPEAARAEAERLQAEWTGDQS